MRAKNRRRGVDDPEQIPNFTGSLYARNGPAVESRFYPAGPCVPAPSAPGVGCPKARFRLQILQSTLNSMDTYLAW
jgi:hypothetical protein